MQCNVIAVYILGIIRHVFTSEVVQIMCLTSKLTGLIDHVTMPCLLSYNNLV